MENWERTFSISIVATAHTHCTFNRRNSSMQFRFGKQQNEILLWWMDSLSLTTSIMLCILLYHMYGQSHFFIYFAFASHRAIGARRVSTHTKNRFSSYELMSSLFEEVEIIFVSGIYAVRSLEYNSRLIHIYTFHLLDVHCTQRIGIDSPLCMAVFGGIKNPEL